MFLNDRRQSSKGGIGFPCGWERGSDIRLQNDHRTSGGIPRRVLVPLRLPEIILRQDLIRADPRFANIFTTRLLHNLSAHVELLAGHL